ncbi:MAG: pyridoxamine 5'-phosphate oxidase family protein [Alphaproteobacteria bacterium]|nr:pyridoxamine 5'-phosphate oxidase family protein [Alphaproteobacteria bacterium]
MLPDDISYVTDEAVLRGMHHKMMSRSSDKVIRRLDNHCRQILALAPFCVIATQGPAGADASPRGDPPGFLRVLDDTHILLPDRVGNNRLDNYANLLANPRIAMLVLVPGMGETLRINGVARITDDPRLLEPCAIRDRAPKIGVLITVEEAFVHCSKALVRSDLWNPEKHIDRKQLASYSQMLIDHVEGLTEEESERQGRVMADRGLY